MRAAAFKEHGGLNVLEVVDLPTPEPQGDEVLIQVKACGLNHLDLWVRQGIPGVKPMPHIGGCEATGVVAKLGPAASGFTVGQKVMVAPGLLPARPSEWTTQGLDHVDPEYRVFGYQCQGGLAEYAVASCRDLLPISDGWSFAEWAAVPLTFMTAWNMLYQRAGLRPGDEVLVMGASSGVGVAALQIAKGGGARVLAVAGGAEKGAKAKALGADHVIDYQTQDVAKEAQKLTGGRGVDIVFEHVGAAQFGAGIKALARNGRLVTCGATTGPKVELDLRFFFTRQIVITGAYMGSRFDLLQCLRQVEAKKLRPVVDKVYPLAEARAAQERMEKRQQFGKIVVTP
jgi:NADPH:quinone reductase-like Zn-dependent oxidoreductase